MTVDVAHDTKEARLPGPEPLVARARGPKLDPRTLIDALDECHLVGDGRGYSFVDADGTSKTYGFRTLVDEARRRGRQLAGMGLRKGDRVALVIPDAEDFVLTFLGAVTQGIVPVPLYPPLSLGRLDAYLGAMSGAGSFDSGSSASCSTVMRSRALGTRGITDHRIFCTCD